ncbi:MAG: phage portal protein [Oscillospiraceae bacterium]|jgi:hypothetical protein|nr:phage portal protein [Oscillospiraceae bacterium]
MSAFAAFMAQNAIKAEPLTVIVSKRFVGEDGVPEEWLVGPVTGAEDEELRREATRRRPPAAGNTRDGYVTEIDYNRYLGLLAARCTLYPDLNDAALQNSYGVLSPDSLLKTMLTAGEFAEYAARVQEVCGFDMDGAVEEAKKP